MKYFERAKVSKRKKTITLKCKTKIKVRAEI